MAHVEHRQQSRGLLGSSEYLKTRRRAHMRPVVRMQHFWVYLKPFLFRGVTTFLRVPYL